MAFYSIISGFFIVDIFAVYLSFDFFRFNRSKSMKPKKFWQFILACIFILGLFTVLGFFYMLYRVFFKGDEGPTAFMMIGTFGSLSLVLLLFSCVLIPLYDYHKHLKPIMNLNSRRSKIKLLLLKMSILIGIAALFFWPK
jgi:hypothetical protein